MRPLLAAVFGATLALLSVPLAGAAAEARDYPIHFDGPMVPHVHGSLEAAGTLPKFDVTFHGGPVQTSTTSYSIFWRPAGTFMSPHYVELIDRFLSDAGGSPIYGMATSYKGSNGQVRNVSKFTDTYTDTSPYPTGGLSDKALQTEIAKVIALKKWTPGVNSAFFILPAKDGIKNPGFCAYHSAFNLNNNNKTPVVYGVIPYVGFVNGCDPPFGITPNKDVDSDGSILNMSHEQMEMVTDPLLNAWYDPNNGEIGDICIFAFGVPYATGGANMLINAHPYFLQEDYSQERHSCQPNL